MAVDFEMEPALLACMAMRKYKLNPATGQLEEQPPPTSAEQQKLLEQSSEVFTEDMTPKIILKIGRFSEVSKRKSPPPRTASSPSTLIRGVKKPLASLAG
jgi:hypothetical protein